MSEKTKKKHLLSIIDKISIGVLISFAQRLHDKKIFPAREKISYGKYLKQTDGDQKYLLAVVGRGD